MSKDDELTIDQGRLIEAWRSTLPVTLNSTDTFSISADESNPKAFRIHIAAAGHTSYTFDFFCTYLDSREVKVELIDVEKDGVSVDERGENIQKLIEDYIRNIHECAQGVQKVTHA